MWGTEIVTTKRRLWEIVFGDTPPDAPGGAYVIKAGETLEFKVKYGAPFKPEKLIVRESVPGSTATELFCGGERMMPTSAMRLFPIGERMMPTSAMRLFPIGENAFWHPVDDGRGFRTEEIVARVENCTDKSVTWLGSLVGHMIFESAK